jgi:hypothetical protein
MFCYGNYKHDFTRGRTRCCSERNGSCRGWRNGVPRLVATTTLETTLTQATIEATAGTASTGGAENFGRTLFRIHRTFFENFKSPLAELECLQNASPFQKNCS